MSRFDYVTIGIVAVCVAALIYLIYMTTNLLGGSKESEKVEEYSPLYEDDTADMDTVGLYSDDYRDLDEWAREDTASELDERSAEATAPPATARQPEARPAAPAPSEYAQRTSASGDFLVLAGTFSVAENAEAMVNKLNGLGYTGAAVEPFDRGKYSVVLVARFDSFSQARSLEQELKGKGIEAYVKRKR